MNSIQNYFNAERAESLFFIAAGLLALAAAAYFSFVLKKPFYLGMAWPLALVALIQITVGTSVYRAAPRQIAQVETWAQQKSPEIRSTEVPRMEQVMRNFVLYRYVEMSLMALGLALIVLNPSLSFWKGAGAGLLLQAGLMLLLDFFAEKRGHEYLGYLNRL